MKTIEIIIKDVITSIYPAFVSGIIFSVLIMFVYNYSKEKGFKNICKLWIDSFKKNQNFRFCFYLAFYIFVVLTKTLLTRPYHTSPLANVWGVWSLHTEKGAINVDPFENFVLFVPFTIFLFMAVKNKLVNRNSLINVVVKSFEFSFVFSLTIELLQVFFKLGTFQILDIVSNTAGGVFGGILYFIFYNISCGRKKAK